MDQIMEGTGDVKDSFRYEGDCYATLNSASQLRTSSDGSAWGFSSMAQDFQLTQVFDDAMVSQELEGWPYRLASSLSVRSRALRLNGEFDTENKSVYSGLERLDHTYYRSVERGIYRSGKLVAVEE